MDNQASCRKKEGMKCLISSNNDAKEALRYISNGKALYDTNSKTLEGYLKTYLEEKGPMNFIAAYDSSGTGKTQLAFALSAAGMKNNTNVLYIPTVISQDTHIQEIYSAYTSLSESFISAVRRDLSNDGDLLQRGRENGLEWDATVPLTTNTKAEPFNGTATKIRLNMIKDGSYTLGFIEAILDHFDTLKKKKEARVGDLVKLGAGLLGSVELTYDKMTVGKTRDYETLVILDECDIKLVGPMVSRNAVRAAGYHTMVMATNSSILNGLSRSSGVSSGGENLNWCFSIMRMLPTNTDTVLSCRGKGNRIAKNGVAFQQLQKNRPYVAKKLAEYKGFSDDMDLKTFTSVVDHLRTSLLNKKKTVYQHMFGQIAQCMLYYNCHVSLPASSQQDDRNQVHAGLINRHYAKVDTKIDAGWIKLDGNSLRINGDPLPGSVFPSASLESFLYLALMGVMHMSDAKLSNFGVLKGESEAYGKRVPLSYLVHSWDASPSCANSANINALSNDGNWLEAEAAAAIVIGSHSGDFTGVDAGTALGVICAELSRSENTYSDLGGKLPIIKEADNVLGEIKLPYLGPVDNFLPLELNKWGTNVSNCSRPRNDVEYDFEAPVYNLPRGKRQQHFSMYITAECKNYKDPVGNPLLYSILSKVPWNGKSKDTKSLTQVHLIFARHLIEKASIKLVEPPKKKETPGKAKPKSKSTKPKPTLDEMHRMYRLFVLVCEKGNSKKVDREKSLSLERVDESFKGPTPVIIIPIAAIDERYPTKLHCPYKDNEET